MKKGSLMGAVRFKEGIRRMCHHGLASLVLLMSLLNAPHAIAGMVHGAVMARSVVLDKNGQPILVEYNEDGTEAGTIAIPSDYQSRVKELQIIPAADYRLEVARLNQFRERYKDDLAVGAQLMDRQQFLAGTYPTADNKQTLTPPSLATTVKSVLVRAQSNRIEPVKEQLVLLAFFVDLTQSYQLPGDAKTLVMTPEGRVVASSTRNIAYRVGYFGDGNKAQDPMAFGRRDPTTPIFGPIPYVRVYSSLFEYSGGTTFTDEEGKYVIRYPTPHCANMVWWANDVYAELYYQNFRPIGAPAQLYYLRRQNWDYCDFFYIGPFGHVYMGASPGYAPIDFKVDVMFLRELVQLRNPDNTIVPLGEQTEYDEL